MEGSWIASHRENRTFHFFGYGIIRIKSAGFLIGTTEYNEVLVLADGDSLRIGKLHIVDLLHRFGTQIDNGRETGYTQVRIRRTVGSQLACIEIGIEFALAGIASGCNVFSIGHENEERPCL